MTHRPMHASLYAVCFLCGLVWAEPTTAEPPRQGELFIAKRGTQTVAVESTDKKPSDKSPTAPIRDEKNSDKKSTKPAAEKKPFDKEAAGRFLRLVRDGGKGPPVAMQTSIVRYVPADGTRAGLVVDLVGAVHVGEKDYYAALNKAFEQYEVLLYELVAPKDTVVPKGGRNTGSGAIGALQRGLKSVLNLEYQLEHIDYTKKNFIHADMSPDEFTKSMKDRDESWLKMYFRMMGQALAQQSSGQGASDADLIVALFSKDRDLQIKRIMAEQFESMGDLMRAMEGDDGSTIISERNKVAFDVLRKQIAAGKTKIGVFYGAGHLPDMEQRLINDFKLKRQNITWIDAWNLRPRASSEQPRPKSSQKTPRPAPVGS